MTTPRAVSRTWQSIPTVEGAGVQLRRALGFRHGNEFDPFLLLDDFRSDDPAQYRKGFPWHPHRGMETITYVLEGDVEHGDSLGNQGVIGSGDVQWMTAGSGIIHQEMPKGDGKGRMYGFQLWANLPARDKMMVPRYQEVKAAAIPRATTPEGATVRVIAGTVGGVQGPVREVVIEPEYLDVSVDRGGSFVHLVKPGHTAFAYVIEGKGDFADARRLGDGSLVSFEREGDEVKVAAPDQAVRFLLVSGRPLGEPVAWQGPIVMNTRDELRTAFEELDRGTFIKSKRK